MLEDLATIEDGHVRPRPAPRNQTQFDPAGFTWSLTSVRETGVSAYLYAAMTARLPQRTLPLPESASALIATLVSATVPPAGQSTVRTVRTWLDYIATWSYEAVSYRLKAAGQVNQVPFMIRRGVYHEPTNPQFDFAGIRIAHDLGSAYAKMCTADVVLAAMLSIAGLLDEVLVYPEKAPACRQRLTQFISDLPEPFAALIREVKGALDGKVLAAR